MKIKKGNAFKLGSLRNGWFLGHFMNDTMLKSRKLEVQLSKLKKGFFKESTKIHPKVKVLTLLVSGKFELAIPSEKKKVVLQKEGDFVRFDLTKKHTGRALKNTKLLTIKWPSLR